MDRVTPPGGSPHLSLLLLSGAHSRERKLNEAHVQVTDQGLAIANAITKLHREYYGRGAASARTVMGRDHLVVFLEDIYTTAERTLIDDGKFQTVRASRQAFQMTMARGFTAAVEEITGRRVRAFMSEVHEDPAIAAEIFVLVPLP